MACQLIWSPAARDDLRSVVSFIASDSRPRAEAFGYRLIHEVERLKDHPELGRVVPEFGNPSIRELVAWFIAFHIKIVPWRSLGSGMLPEASLSFT